MESIRQYIMSVICVVFLCGVAQIFVSESRNTLMRFASGLIITATVLSPVLNADDFSLDLFFDDISVDSEGVVREGELAAHRTTSEFIKEKMESYILDKAKELDAQITVAVRLTDDQMPVPAEITVCGNLSPYVKRQLSDQIKNDLGIDEDNQIWIS